MPSSTNGSFKSPSFKSFRGSKGSKRARKKELETASATEDTNNNEAVELAENSAVVQLKKKHPLVSSRSLLRIGLLKNRNNQSAAVAIAGQELPSNNNNNNCTPTTPASTPASLQKDQKAVLKARKKMTQRASSLSDFFHHSSTGTPTRPLPASSMAAAAMSANRRTSRPFSNEVPFFALTSEPSSSQSSSASAANSSSFCCSGLRKSRSRGNSNVHSTAHAIALSNATVLGLPNSVANTDAMSPEYGAVKNRGSASTGGAESSIMACSRGPEEVEYSSSVGKQLLSGLQPNARPTALRKLSKAFFNSQNGDRLDLMNDWEIGGTQNAWVCPSDRHLQLRAQLKSGWSVRTSTARSPTNAKQNVTAGISDAEREQIRKVLERAEQGKQNEQLRIGKMVDRLEKLRGRATGNGVTQCLLCQTEFGLLASKSYAACCIDCRKYVCQKNCGVETFDQKRGELIFLCKICSEYREVMWKKSGAWFYKEMPNYTKPFDNLPSSNPMGNGLPLYGNRVVCGSPTDSTPTGSRTNFLYEGNAGRRLLNNNGSAIGSASVSPLNAFGKMSMYEESSSQALPSCSLPSNAFNGGSNSSANSAPSTGFRTHSRQLPIPPDQQQRLKTTPRPRITPSWVHEKVQSSISMGSEDESSSESSLDHTEFRQTMSGKKENEMTSSSHTLNTAPVGNNCKSKNALSARKHHHYNRPKDLPTRHQNSFGRETSSLQRFVLGSRSRMTDTEDSENDESRRSTPSTSPRHSIATPSSYGGDDLSQNHATLAAGNEASDARMDVKSIDSGVVQSDQSATLAAANYTSPPPPKSSARVGGSSSSLANQNSSRVSTNSPSPLPPPIPPRSATIGTVIGTPRMPSSSIVNLSSNHFKDSSPKRPSSASSSTNSSLVPLSMSLVGVNVKSQQRGNSQQQQSSHESLYSSAYHRHNSKQENTAGGSRPESGHSSDFMPGSTSGDYLTGAVSALERVEEGNSRRSNQSSSLTRKESEFSEAESPTFMSSPEDDTSTLGSVQFNLTYLPAEKQLIIHLIRAKNLKAMDKNGFSDPYVKFHLIPGNTKATKLSSKTIEKTLNPEWNEEMIYYGITEEERLRKVLRLTVLDRDRIGSDFLGETRVALKKLPMGTTKKFNLYLEHAIPSQLEKSEDMERGKILVAVCYNIQQGSLFVNIKRCAELLGMDSTGFSDPYCKVSLTPLSSKAHRQKTSIKKRTLNPEFNTTLQFIVPFKDLPKKTLEISVFDHDVARSDDFIGGILLSTAAKDERGKQWIQCIENPGKTFENWHKLTIE